MPQVSEFPFPNSSGDQCSHTLAPDPKILDSQKLEPERPAQAFKKQKGSQPISVPANQSNSQCPLSFVPKVTYFSADSFPKTLHPISELSPAGLNPTPASLRICLILSSSPPSPTFRKLGNKIGR